MEIKVGMDAEEIVSLSVQNGPTWSHHSFTLEQARFLRKELGEVIWQAESADEIDLPYPE